MAEQDGLEEAIRRAADPLVLMKRVADEAMGLVGDVDGVLVGFVHDPEWVSFDCGAGHTEAQIGKRVPVAGTLAGLAYRTGETLYSKDAEMDPRIDIEFARSAHVRSVVFLPLWRGKQTVGVLCVASRRPNAFDERDVATLESLAEFISVVIVVALDLASVTEALLAAAGRDRAAKVPSRDDRDAEERFVANVLSPGAMKRIENRSWIDRFLRGRGLAHVFQPIYDVRDGECFAVEALARFAGQPNRTPDVWFAEAHEMGLGVELELASVERALGCLDRLPPDIYLCVNAGPEAMISDELRQLLVASKPGRIVMELTEEAKVDDYERLSVALERLYAMSLAHILKLTPHIIKLDRELTSGIDRDPVRVTLASALVSFAAGLGAEIVAEGIEIEAELDMLCDLGIRYGQGFLLSRPTSLDALQVRLPGTLSHRRDQHGTSAARFGQLVAFPARR